MAIIIGHKLKNTVNQLNNRINCSKIPGSLLFASDLDPLRFFTEMYLNVESLQLSLFLKYNTIGSNTDLHYPYSKNSNKTAIGTEK